MTTRPHVYILFLLPACPIPLLFLLHPAVHKPLPVPLKTWFVLFLTLKLPICLRKQMLQKQAALERGFEPSPVCVITAQGQFGSG